MKLAVHDTKTGHWSGKRANHISCVSQETFTHSSQDSYLQPFLTYIVFSDSHKLQEHLIKLPDAQKKTPCNVHHDQAMYIHQEGEVPPSASFNTLTFQY